MSQIFTKVKLVVILGVVLSPLITVTGCDDTAQESSSKITSEQQAEDAYMSGTTSSRDSHEEWASKAGERYLEAMSDTSSKYMDWIDETRERLQKMAVSHTIDSAGGARVDLYELTDGTFVTCTTTVGSMGASMDCDNLPW